MVAVHNHDENKLALTPLCALGASAGGVAALKSFFSHIESDLGLAYVIIMLPASDRPSLLSDTIDAETTMPVFPIEDTIKLQPNCVYVVPPTRELAIDGDYVTARTFTGSRARHSPIDMFFQSVAAGRCNAIAVLLSGSGSDGMVGARAIKEAGGVIFAQEPAEAEYSTKPKSVIATGVVDFVAPVADLARRLAKMTRNNTVPRKLREEDDELLLREIIAFLRFSTGYDFSGYRRPGVLRRLDRRMQVAGQENIGDYYRYLQNNEREAQELLSNLLNPIPTFFRDSEAFAALAENAIKPLFDKLDDGTLIRIWDVGCATGEEAYSIGLLLLEEAARRGVNPLIQIFASDIDGRALALARDGRYPNSIAIDVSEERLRRFFIQDGGHYCVKKELRDLILFAVHDALMDPPFIKIDLISCRNLLVDLQPQQQRQLTALFHHALNPRGYVFLGSAEYINAAKGLFAPVDLGARIYMATGVPETITPTLPLLTADLRSIENRPVQPAQTEHSTIIMHAHAAALKSSAPPSVLIDSSFKILHLSPKARFFLLPSDRPESVTLPDQVHPELWIELKLVLQRAFEKGEASLTTPIPVPFDGGARLVSLHVMPCKEGNQIAVGKAVVFFMDLGVAPPSR